MRTLEGFQKHAGLTRYWLLGVNKSQHFAGKKTVLSEKAHGAWCGYLVESPMESEAGFSPAVGCPQLSQLAGHLTGEGVVRCDFET